MTNREIQIREMKGRTFLRDLALALPIDFVLGLSIYAIILRRPELEVQDPETFKQLLFLCGLIATLPTAAIVRILERD